MKLSLYLVVLLSMLLGACTNSVVLNSIHSYTGDDPMMDFTIRVRKQDVLISKDNPLSSMTFALSSEVKNNSKLISRGFSQDTFASTIKEKLLQTGLLNESANTGYKLELTVVESYLVGTAESVVLASEGDGSISDFSSVNYSKIVAIIKDSTGNIVDDYLYWRTSACDYCDPAHRAQIMYDITATITARAISVKGH